MKLSNGKKCTTGRITQEANCKKAATELNLKWGNAYSGPSTFPGCQFANDGRSTVYFNTALKAKGNNPKYQEICLKGSYKSMGFNLLHYTGTKSYT